MSACLRIISACLAAGVSTTTVAWAESAPDDITEITVLAGRVANERPAATYASVATALRFDPLTELQSRGLAEAQADVTVRGGLFENTGFAVGAVSVMDPQTGHYAAGLPIDPGFLSPPKRLTDVDNALAGFNSAIGTIQYGLRSIVPGGDLRLGAGSDAFRLMGLRAAGVLDENRARTLAASFSAAASRGDGSLPDGDHSFERYNLRLQRISAGGQSDLVLAHQDKFFGWPGAYTGFADASETDHTKTTLFLGNHRQELERGWVELGAYHRRLVDDYDFDRNSPVSGVPGAFEHETRVEAIGVQGALGAGRIEWRYSGQVTRDELVASTDLTEGAFTSRRYLRLGLAPTLRLHTAGSSEVEVRFGITFDDSNRDGSRVSPLAGVKIGFGASYLGIEYAETSQVPGYTALNSPPVGLFGGNAGLGRKTARQVTLSAGREAAAGQLRAAVFHRRDDDLVDWTFSRGAVFARQANALDAKVNGAEILIGRQWERFDLSAGYTWIDKDADYGQADVDASFYALNYARHRATVATSWRIRPYLVWRMDGEYRVQAANPLRTGGHEAFIAAVSLTWQKADGRGPGIVLTADNVTDADFQSFPGTPAVGRQVGLVVRYGW